MGLEAKEMNETFNECYTPPIKFGCHISQKMTAKNALKRQTQNTLISTQQTHFFCIVVSTCQRQDRSNKLRCTYKLKEMTKMTN